MSSETENMLEILSKDFLSAYKWLIYAKQKDIDWCIEHTNQIVEEAIYLRKLLFKQINSGIGKRLAKNAQYMRNLRANESNEQTSEKRAADALNKRNTRANELTEQRSSRRAADNARHALCVCQGCVLCDDVNFAFMEGPSHCGWTAREAP